MFVNGLQDGVSCNQIDIEVFRCRKVSWVLSMHLLCVCMSLDKVGPMVSFSCLRHSIGSIRSLMLLVEIYTFII